MKHKLKLDHIHYRYSDRAETTRFYVDIMEAKDLGPVLLNGVEHLQFELGGVPLLFAPATAATPRPAPGTDRLGIYHIALHVEDCHAATAHYVQRNGGDDCIVVTPPETVSVKPPTPTGEYIVSFLQAPDGMMIELKQVVA